MGRFNDFSGKYVIYIRAGLTSLFPEMYLSNFSTNISTISLIISYNYTFRSEYVEIVEKSTKFHWLV